MKSLYILLAITAVSALVILVKRPQKRSVSVSKNEVHLYI
jgi:hypothetical protein